MRAFDWYLVLLMVLALGLHVYNFVMSRRDRRKGNPHD